MRDRAIDVYYHVDLLGEAMETSKEACRNIIDLVASEYTVGWSLVDEVREYLSKMKPDLLAKHLVGGWITGEMEAGGFDLAKYSQISLLGAAAVNEQGYFVIPPVLLMYALYGLKTALIVFIASVVINEGVQNFYQPKLMGQRLRISPVVVFISLLVWGYLLGGIGAILAVLITLLVLILMENFEGTRTIAILMCYTGEEKNEDRKDTVMQVQYLWGRVKGTFTSNNGEEKKNT